MPDSPISTDVDTSSVKTEKSSSKKRQPNQNYPLLTREQCSVVAHRLMELRKHKLQRVDIEAYFSVNGYENPRVTWQATVVYDSPVLNTEEKIINWMIDSDKAWMQKHPANGPLNDSKGTCNSCGTELKWKLVCSHCDQK
jgi:hypothetical protein